MIFLILIILLAVTGFSFVGKGRNEDYMSPDSTASVNGLFIMLVFYRHLVSYRTFDSLTDLPMNCINSWSGQLIVAGFLFFSGYGIMENYRRYGNSYAKRIPKFRILRTWLRFAATVSLYGLVNCLLGRPDGWRKYLTALTGWQSIGNSNWYIFVILWLYFFGWVAMMAVEKLRPEYREAGIAALHFLLTTVMILILREYQEDYWYNTALVFPAGMAFSVYRKKWEGFLLKKPVNYRLTVAGVLILWGIVYQFRDVTAVYEAAAVLMALSLVLILWKFRAGSPILLWMGRHLFGLYMGQRLCMILWREASISSGLYLAVCAGMTWIVGWCIDVGTAAAADLLLGRSAKA